MHGMTGGVGCCGVRGIKDAFQPFHFCNCKEDNAVHRNREHLENDVEGGRKPQYGFERVEL